MGVIALSAQPAQERDYRLLDELGSFLVPSHYRHETRLSEFERLNEHHFHRYNSDFTDENLTNASNRLVPFELILVELWAAGASHTSDDHLAFLEEQESVLFGAQGATLVWEFLHKRLPEDSLCLSYDRPGCLPLIGGQQVVPYLYHKRSETDVDEWSFAATGLAGMKNPKHALLVYRRPQ